MTSRAFLTHMGYYKNLIPLRKGLGKGWFFGLINGILLDYMTFCHPFCRDDYIENFFCLSPIVIAFSCGDPHLSRLVFTDVIIVLLSPMVFIVVSYAPILASILSKASSLIKKNFSTCSSHLTVLLFFYTAMFSYMNRSIHDLDKDKPFSLLHKIISPMYNPIIYNFQNKEMKEAMVGAFGKTSLVLPPTPPMAPFISLAQVLDSRQAGMDVRETLAHREQLSCMRLPCRSICPGSRAGEVHKEPSGTAKTHVITRSYPEMHVPLQSLLISMFWVTQTTQEVVDPDRITTQRGDGSGGR
ncbi:LOW QUALITY PROTEIN: olfactory receptor 10AD1 [Rhynchonycteris naso]